MRERRFREDLYFRLSLPSLSERRADVLPLAERLLASAARRFGSEALQFSAEALALREHFAWDRAGNICGLEHTVERTVLMLDSGRHRIERDDIILSELLETSPSIPMVTAPGWEPQRPAVPLTRVEVERSLRELLVDKVKLHTQLDKRTVMNATISPCGRYRYPLSRPAAGTEKGTLLFVMLNPSTAGAAENDPTIRRRISFESDLGFSTLEVGNLFAIRSSNSRAWRSAADPIGPDNEHWLMKCPGQGPGRMPLHVPRPQSRRLPLPMPARGRMQHHTLLKPRPERYRP